MDSRSNLKERFIRNIPRELLNKRGSLLQRQGFFNKPNKLEYDWLLKHFPISNNKELNKSYYCSSDLYPSVLIIAIHKLSLLKELMIN